MRGKIGFSLFLVVSLVCMMPIVKGDYGIGVSNCDTKETVLLDSTFNITIARLFNTGDVPLNVTGEWIPKNAIYSNDDGQYTNSTAYVKIKEATIPARVQQYYIRFSLESNHKNGIARARIYVNDEPIGVEHETTRWGYQKFSEDFKKNTLQQGDRVQIYAKINNSTFQAIVKDFHIYATNIIVNIPSMILHPPEEKAKDFWITGTSSGETGICSGKIQFVIQPIEQINGSTSTLIPAGIATITLNVIEPLDGLSNGAPVDGTGGYTFTNDLAMYGGISFVIISVGLLLYFKRSSILQGRKKISTPRLRSRPPKVSPTRITPTESVESTVGENCPACGMVHQPLSPGQVITCKGCGMKIRKSGQQTF